MKETIKRAFLWWIVFLWTILFWFMWYSAWTSLTADIPNQNSWDLMTSSIWNNLVDKLNKTIDNVNLLNTSISSINSVPAWAVMAFNLSNCPTWWAEYIPAQGKFIRWIDKTGTNIDPDGQRNLWNIQNATSIHNEVVQTVHPVISNWDWLWPAVNVSRWPWQASSTVSSPSTKVRPINVALLYCIKN